MEKPEMIVSEPYWDYSDVMRYLEKKYNFDSRDYKGSHKHFNTWLQLTGEEEPIYPVSPNNIYLLFVDGRHIEITKEEYDRRFEEIHKQYARFQEWEKTNPRPKYCDFWHWIYDMHPDIGNGYFFSLETVYDEDDEIPDWVQEILTLIRKEFIEEDESSLIRFWVEW